MPLRRVEPENASQAAALEAGLREAEPVPRPAAPCTERKFWHYQEVCGSATQKNGILRLRTLGPHRKRGAEGSGWHTPARVAVDT